jgi:hypothetical protein
VTDQAAFTHGPDCGCTRCRGFQPENEHRVGPGNDLAAKHGAYATVKLGSRVAELADRIRELVPGYAERDEPAVRLLCLALARLEASSTAIADASAPDELKRLRDDERGWANTARRYLNDLGLTPTSRAKLGLHVARARGEALRAHLEQHYGDGQG